MDYDPTYCHTCTQGMQIFRNFTFDRRSTMLYKRVENKGITIRMTAVDEKLVFQTMLRQTLKPDKGYNLFSRLKMTNKLWQRGVASALYLDLIVK